MKAKILDSKLNVYDVHEVVGTRVTIKQPCDRGFKSRYIDFSLDEVEFILEGINVEVYRNQATRNGNWIGFKKGKGYALSYVMPSGKCFINLCKNPFNLEDYTTISEDKFKKLFD